MWGSPNTALPVQGRTYRRKTRPHWLHGGGGDIRTRTITNIDGADIWFRDENNYMGVCDANGWNTWLWTTEPCKAS